jgi:two-component system chemotaxis response regulator CheB
LTSAETPEPAAAAVPERLEVEVKIASEHDPLQAGVRRLGEPSTFSCPECHGVLLQLKEAGRIRFRCHTGHAYSADSLQAEITEAIEAELWSAMRLMHEGDLLMRGIATHVEGHTPADAERLRRGAADLLRKAAVLRELITTELEAASAKP